MKGSRMTFVKHVLEALDGASPQDITDVMDELSVYRNTLRCQQFGHPKFEVVPVKQAPDALPLIECIKCHKQWKLEEVGT
jgi:hypothetical protein